LVLSEGESFAETIPLDRAVRERTLEAWVALATLDQAGGGVVTIETIGGSVFDSIVFAEKQPRRWINGSDFFRRGRDQKAEEETSGADRLVHVAIRYAEDGTITFFRNGEIYGAPFQPKGGGGDIITYAAGGGRLLFGRRHTGGGNAFLRGEIDEARLYDRALSPAEIAASFAAGPDLVVSPAPPADLDEVTKTRLDHLRRQIAALESLIASERPAISAADGLLTKAAERDHPLHPWAQYQRGSWFENQPAVNHGTPLMTSGDATGWFRQGSGLSRGDGPSGDFAIEPEGDKILTRLYPRGVFTASLSRRQNGVLHSPGFKVETDRLRLQAAGGAGAQIRLIVDNYPIPQNNTYSKTVLNGDAPKWITFDTAFRRNTWAYIEVTTAFDASRKGGQEPKDGRSWFWISDALTCHPDSPAPREEFPWSQLLPAEKPATREALAVMLGEKLRAAVVAWREGRASDEQVLWLDSAMRAGLLASQSDQIAGAADLLNEYRKLERELPIPRRAPGVMEGTAVNAPFLPRGDHKFPGEAVPRGFLSVMGGGIYATSQSGRLELARDLTRADNPLTARVIANRIWLHLFGRGLVPTPDNFGRLGEKPSHPALLDHLAMSLVRDGWSLKKSLRRLVLSEAYALDSEPSSEARNKDPSNQWLSHFRVRRMEGEAIRDAMLSLSGRLDLRMGGEGDRGGSNRRSVYLNLARNNLPDLLVAFDFPAPASTRGDRDATNVPAQALTLFNNPVVRDWSRAWVQRELTRPAADDRERFSRLSLEAFGRAATDTEWKQASAFLGESPANPAAWQDLAHALFNAREFVYLR
jgi:hypothetical protein